MAEQAQQTGQDRQQANATAVVSAATEHKEIAPGFSSLQSFELAQRVAKLLSQSTLVPKEYQGNLPNCVIAVNMAARIQADVMMVMQNLHVIQGRPGWSSQFLISAFNTCGRFTALRYEWVGKPHTDEWGCRAWAIERATGERLTGALVTIGIAKKEGWYGRNGSKWQTMPEQMLMYRAASWFVRAYAPELALGMQTAEELADVIDLAPDDYEVREVAQNANSEPLDVTPEGEDAAKSNEAQPDTGSGSSDAGNNAPSQQGLKMEPGF